MHIFRPARVVIGVRLLHCFDLFRAHPKRLMMGAGEPLARAQLGEHRLDVFDRAAHPLQVDILETFRHKRRAHIVVR